MYECSVLLKDIDVFIICLLYTSRTEYFRNNTIRCCYLFIFIFTGINSRWIDKRKLADTVVKYAQNFSLHRAKGINRPLYVLSIQLKANLYAGPATGLTTFPSTGMKINTVCESERPTAGARLPLSCYVGNGSVCGRDNTHTHTHLSLIHI